MSRRARLRARSTGDGARPVELVVITGYSGAGKSEAIAAFEDGGYFCVDNLPPRMIGALGELFRHEGSGVRRAAVVTDVRGGEYFDELLAGARRAASRRARPEGPLPRGRRGDAAHRFKETRRRHPLARTAGSSTGSARSASCSAPLRERADVVIDTTDLTGAMLRRRIATELLGRARPRPARADHPHLRLQERPAPRRRPRPRRPLPAQPALREDLRPLTGRDAEVVEYVESGDAGAASSTAGCCRCSTSCCPPTSPRARRT